MGIPERVGLLEQQVAELFSHVGSLANSTHKVMATLQHVCGCPGLRERFEEELPEIEQLKHDHHHPEE